jgi:alkyl hydroperoxide reductase subunit AhpC
MLITNDYEAFEFVKNHLLTQKEKAWSDSEDCQYRGYLSSTLDNVREQAIAISIDENFNNNNHYDNDYDYDIFYDILAGTENDAKCAVGCLILDEFYDTEMEGKTIEPDEMVWDIVVKSNPAWNMTDNSLKMLKALQSIHDGKTPEQWEVELSRLNVKFDKYKDYEPDTDKE